MCVQSKGVLGIIVVLYYLGIIILILSLLSTANMGYVLNKELAFKYIMKNVHCDSWAVSVSQLGADWKFKFERGTGAFLC